MPSEYHRHHLGSALMHPTSFQSIPVLPVKLSPLIHPRTPTQLNSISSQSPLLTAPVVLHSSHQTVEFHHLSVATPHKLPITNLWPAALKGWMSCRTWCVSRSVRRSVGPSFLLSVDSPVGQSVHCLVRRLVGPSVGRSVGWSVHPISSLPHTAHSSYSCHPPALSSLLHLLAWPLPALM